MEVKRICQWCGKPFMAKKTTTNIVVRNVPKEVINTG